MLEGLNQLGNLLQSVRDVGVRRTILIHEARKHGVPLTSETVYVPLTGDTRPAPFEFNLLSYSGLPSNAEWRQLEEHARNHIRRTGREDAVVVTKTRRGWQSKTTGSLEWNEAPSLQQLLYPTQPTGFDQ